MALVITDTSVVVAATPAIPALTRTANAGVAITAGMALYIDANSVWQKSDCNASAATKRCDGIALNNGAAGQPITAITSGPVTIGATITKGASYYVSGTAGGIDAFAGLTTGDELIPLGYAYSTTVLIVQIVNGSGITL